MEHYIVNDWMDKKACDIKKESDLWDATSIASWHRGNPSFLPNDFIPNIYLYPISSTQDWTKPAKLLVWWNTYNLHKWRLRNNALALYETLSLESLDKLKRNWFIDNIINESEKWDKASIWTFHRKWYKMLADTLNFQLSDFSKLILDNKELVKSILYNTINYIKKNYANYQDILFTKIFYKKIDTFWIMHKYNNEILEEKMLDTNYLINEFFKTIENIDKLKNGVAINNLSWIFISWSFAVFLYDLLLWKETNKGIVYHFSSKTHYEEWKTWTEQNIFFNKIYANLLENGIEIPETTTSYVIYHTLADRLTFCHPKWTKEDIEEYWLILRKIINDYKECWDFSVEEMKCFFNKMILDKKWSLWWDENIIDYVSKHKSDLTYFLSWYDQILSYNRVWMTNTPIEWLNNLSYQEKSDIQQKIKEKMLI